MAQAPAEYLIRLQHGITGGFAPPTPKEMHSLTRSSEDPGFITVESYVRAPGEPGLQPTSYKPKKHKHSDKEKEVAELVEILKSLPVESPPGSEDIYGMDTSIFFASDEFQWTNGGPAGCGGGESSVRPTAEQKRKFTRAVEIVKDLTKGPGA